LTLKLGGDPADDEYPDKPKRMRWTTYNRLMDKLVAADEIADARLLLAAQCWGDHIETAAGASGHKSKSGLA